MPFSRYLNITKAHSPYCYMAIIKIQLKMLHLDIEKYSKGHLYSEH